MVERPKVPDELKMAFRENPLAVLLSANLREWETNPQMGEFR